MGRLGPFEENTIVAVMPSGGYGAILADPPWRYGNWSKDSPWGGIAEKHYPVMSTEDICVLPVQELGKDHCALFLWATWPTLPEALQVIVAWGFRYKTIAFLWAKLNSSGVGFFTGMGHWTRANTEPCLLATRGSPKRNDRAVKQLIITPIQEHSRKPAEIHKRIMRLVDGPYLELFARRPFEGWDVWGNEIA